MIYVTAVGAAPHKVCVGVNGKQAYFFIITAGQAAIPDCAGYMVLQLRWGSRSYRPPHPDGTAHAVAAGLRGEERVRLLLRLLGLGHGLLLGGLTYQQRAYHTVSGKHGRGRYIARVAGSDCGHPGHTFLCSMCAFDSP